MWLESVLRSTKSAFPTWFFPSQVDSSVTLVQRAWGEEVNAASNLDFLFSWRPRPAWANLSLDFSLPTILTHQTPYGWKHCLFKQHPFPWFCVFYLFLVCVFSGLIMSFAEQVMHISKWKMSALLACAHSNRMVSMWSPQGCLTPFSSCFREMLWDTLRSSTLMPLSHGDFWNVPSKEWILQLIEVQVLIGLLTHGWLVECQVAMPDGKGYVSFLRDDSEI